MRSYDAIVVGAGPGGSVCARRLASAGLRTALLDRLAPPRYKTCGGGVVGRALPHLGIELAGVSERVCHLAELSLFDEELPGGRLGFEVERAEPIVVMTMRADLDRALVDAARQDGAELVAPCSVSAVSTEGGTIRVETDRGVFAAPVVVGADGANSAVARMTGFGELPCSIPALESEVRVEPRVLERFSRLARFDFGLVDEGYCWVFPKREHLSVGCVATRGGGARLKALLETYLERLGLGSSVEREDHGFVIPVEPRRGPLARQGILLVGDAAGLADPVTCEGISHAAASGRLAARAIVDSAGDPAGAGAAYVGALERGLLRELHRARFLARILYSSRLRRLIFRRLGRPLVERMADVITGDLTYREIVGRPGAWLRGVAALVGGGVERE